MTNYPDWYISKIKQFVNIGFFGGTNDNSLKAIAERIIKESEKSYFGNILDLKENSHLEQILVSYDRKRVWFVEDWLSYGLSQDNFYANVFAHLSEISEGILNPKNIKIEECGYCDGRDKRLTVCFQLKEKAFNVNFCTDGTVLTLKFLEEINEFLVPQKCSFEYIFDVYGLGFIFFLNQSQKEYLSNRPEWKFNENPGYWLDRALFCRDTADNENAEKYFKKAIEDSYDYYFVISEYGRFLEGQNKQNAAIEIYEKGIRQLKSLEVLNENEKWWLSSLENDFKQLLKKGSH
jgi:tetratricopeptide (TPR) repeat protein